MLCTSRVVYRWQKVNNSMESSKVRSHVYGLQRTYLASNILTRIRFKVLTNAHLRLSALLAATGSLW